MMWSAGQSVNFRAKYALGFNGFAGNGLLAHWQAHHRAHWKAIEAMDGIWPNAR